jgi:mycobactin peptide synthetase MbtE
VRVVPDRSVAEFIEVAADRPGRAETHLIEQLRQPFDLPAGRVWRAVLVHDHAPQQWLFGIAVHHIAFDGWSQHLIAREIGLAYAERGRDRTVLPAAAVTDPAHTYHLVDTLARAAGPAEQRAFWTERLRDLPAVRWPVPGGTTTGDRGPESIEYALDRATVEGLSQVARQQGTGLLAVLLDEVFRTVSGRTGQTDLGIGVPVSLRSTEALQTQVGCLINTVCVPLRNPGPGGVAAALADALAHADLPFPEVVQAVRPPRTGRHPLYQVITAVQDSPEPMLGLSGCRTVLGDHDVFAWPAVELLVELLPNRQSPGLRVTRTPGALGHTALVAIADALVTGLRSRAAHLRRVRTDLERNKLA